MSEWTETPWRVEQDYTCTPSGITPVQKIHAGETLIARFTILSQLGDADRAVTCVNACHPLGADPAGAIEKAREALRMAGRLLHAVQLDPGCRVDRRDGARTSDAIRAALKALGAGR